MGGSAVVIVVVVVGCKGVGGRGCGVVAGGSGGGRG